MKRTPFPYRLVIGTRGDSSVAFSLVHPIERIDVPHDAVHSVTASDTDPFPWLGCGPIPRVVLHLHSDIRERLVRLTRAMMQRSEDDRTLEIWVGKTCVSKPVVRECIGTLPTFFINTSCLEEAQALAVQLGAGRPRPQLRLVGS